MSRNDLFNKTEHEARVLRVTGMLPETGPLTDKHIAGVQDDASRYLKEHGVAYADLAAAIGENQTYVSNFFTGAAAMAVKTRDRLARAIVTYLEEDYRHRSARLETAFVQTVVAKRLFNLARNVKATRDMGVGYGPAGIGKTACAMALTQELPGTIYIRVTKACRSEAGLLRKIWSALRRTHRQRRNPPGFDEVADELRGTGRLLILDQAHDLKDPAFRLLMDLHDECELPILLLGTIDVRNKVKADNDPHYGQFSSRVGPRINLLKEFTEATAGRGQQWLTIAQIRAMFRTGKLKLSGDAARMLATIALTRIGCLRAAQRIYKWAERSASAEGATEITLAHVQQSIEWIDDGDIPITRMVAEDDREALTA